MAGCPVAIPRRGLCTDGLIVVPMHEMLVHIDWMWPVHVPVVPFDCPQTSIGRGGERLGPVKFLVNTGAHLAMIRSSWRTMRS